MEQDWLTLAYSQTLDWRNAITLLNTFSVTPALMPAPMAQSLHGCGKTQARLTQGWSLCCGTFIPEWSNSAASIMALLFIAWGLAQVDRGGCGART